MYNNIDENTWVEEYQWIGIVRQRDQKPNVTLITPLVYYDVDQKWRTVSSNECGRYFPNNGKVARFTSDFPQSKRERLLSFHPERNKKPASSEHDSYHSFYLTFSHPDFAPLGQILDWNYRAREVFDLPALLEQGISEEDCLSHQVYIRHRDSLYGPIHLDPDRTNPQLLKPREYLQGQGSSKGGQPLLLTEYPFNKDDILTLENKPFVNPNNIGSPVQLIDLSLPQVVMKRILQASNNISSNDLENNVSLTKRKIENLAFLSSSDGPEPLRVEPSTLRRAQYIIHHQINNIHVLKALLEELPIEHPLMQKARQFEIEHRKVEIEQEAIKQCEAEQNHLCQLQEQVQAEKQNLQTLREQAQTIQNTLAEREQEIEQAKQKYEHIRADFNSLERSMQKRLTELRQEPLQLLADLQLLTALPSSLLQPLSRIVADNSKSGIVASPDEQPRFFTDEFALDEATHAGNLHSLSWRVAAKEGEANLTDTKIYAAALIAGLVPAPEGPAAANIWHAVARVLTGSRVWFVPVPLTALSPLDLFGSIASDQSRFVPAAGGLADILLEAFAHPTQLAIVVLEGIDRVPTLPVLAPLLQMYRRVRQNIQQGVTHTRHSINLNLFHPRALTLDDPYQKLSSFIWPENLLLGATFDNEVSSLPIPMMYTSWFVHTEPKFITRRSKVISQKDWQVSPELWYTWEKELFTNTNKDQGENWPEHLDQWQRQFYRSMEDFAIKEEERDAIIEDIWPQQS